jgi:hypothetical protein
MKKVIVFGVDGLMMPLLKQFVSEGILPNIQKMLKDGAATELLPFVSAWGDVNWVSFLTGQCPGTSWIGQALPPDNSRTRNLLFLMEESGHQAALVHFPESVLVENPHFRFAPYWGRKTASPYELASPAIHTTRIGERGADRKPKPQKLGWPPASALAYHEKDSWRGIDRKGASYRLNIQANCGDAWVVNATASGRDVSIRVGDQAITLALGQWSRWLPLEVRGEPGCVRLFVGAHEPENNVLEILQSQVMKTKDISNDISLEKELFDHCGPFIGKWTSKVTPTDPYLQAAVQEAGYQSEWLAESALLLTQKKGYSLWASVHRLIDESHHNCIGQYDPSSPFYIASESHIFGNVMRQCYRVLDRTIGRIIDEMDLGTTLLLVSDHGTVPNSYMCDIYRYLAKHQLVKLHADGTLLKEESRVFLKDERGGLEIYVNLVGREDAGIVLPSDYEKVREALLQALTTWRIEEDGRSIGALSMALRKEDATGIGYWGQNAGDVIFAYNTGFVWGVSANGEDICRVAAPGANHGPQKPTAETGISSNYGVLLAYGASIRQGYHRNRNTLGPYRMVDPAATIAHLLQIGQSSLDGVVMSDLLNNDSF